MSSNKEEGEGEGEGVGGGGDGVLVAEMGGAGVQNEKKSYFTLHNTSLFFCGKG